MIYQTPDHHDELSAALASVEDLAELMVRIVPDSTTVVPAHVTDALDSDVHDAGDVFFSCDLGLVQMERGKSAALTLADLLERVAHELRMDEMRKAVA